MTSPASVPAPLPQKKLQRFEHHDFLPAALEILEKPPSPIGMYLILAICALFASALAWAYVGHIDIIAVAPGTLRPVGQTKMVQPLVTGRISYIHVKNGDYVGKGDLLVALDPSESLADEAAYAADLSSVRAEVLRRRAAMLAARKGQISAPPLIDWPASIPPRIRQREMLVLAADLLQLKSQVSSLDAQVREKQAERTRLIATIAAQNALIQTLQERVDMRTTLLEKAAGSKASLIDATETLNYQKTALAQQIGQKAETEAALFVLANNIQKAYDTFISDNAQKLANAERQAGDLAEKLIKARAITSHYLLRSPIDGVVQASIVTTVGQVLTSGEEVMRIVPQRAPLEIECYLPNKDIGFVHAGQEAVIKVEAFPFTRYGTIKARVVRVAHDAITDPNARQIESNPGAPLKAALQPTGAEQTQELVFPVTLQPERASFDINGKKIPLQAGMAVTAEISTGRRRILEYLFSPLVEIGSQSMHER